jgi:hypothetical protein
MNTAREIGRESEGEMFEGLDATPKRSGLTSRMEDEEKC